MLDGARRVLDDASTSRILALAGNYCEREQNYKWMVLDNVGCRMLLDSVGCWMVPDGCWMMQA